MKVVVTRAEAQAAPLVARLEALGHEVVRCPLIRVDHALPRAFGGGQKCSSRRQLVPQPLLRVDARHEIRLVPVTSERLRGGGTDRREPSRRPDEAPGELVGAVRARDDDPVVARQIERRSGDDPVALGLELVELAQR